MSNFGENGGFRRERRFHRRYFSLGVDTFKIAPDMVPQFFLQSKRTFSPHHPHTFF